MATQDVEIYYGWESGVAKRWSTTTVVVRVMDSVEMIEAEALRTFDNLRFRDVLFRGVHRIGKIVEDLGRG